MRHKNGIVCDDQYLGKGKVILMKTHKWMDDRLLVQGLRILVLVFLTLLLTACGSFQVSFEQGGENSPVVTDEVNPVDTPQEPVSQLGITGQDGEGPFYIGSLFSPGSGEADTILEVRQGVAAFTQSPVEAEMLWDYSGPSGRIAYASEFFHGSRDYSRSVSDLWVYDYASDTSEMWLEDDVSRAYWSPYFPESSEPQQLAAAVFDSSSGTYDLVLVDGPSQTRTIAQCASEEFAFSPDGKQIAYKSGWYNGSVPRPEDCEGVLIVNLEDHAIRKVSETDPMATGGWIGDQPLWAESLQALLFKSYDETSIFNLVPLDGSGWNPVVIAPTIGEEHLPVPFYSLWADAYRIVIGQTEGMFDPFGVWVYRLSAEGDLIEEAFRVDWGEYRHDLLLIGWWELGESVILRDITYLSGLNPLGDVVVWSLNERAVVDTISSTPDFPMTLYPVDISTGDADLDAILQAFLSGSPSERAAFAETITAGCTNESFVVGPPPCEEGMAEGTRLERFPYRRYREQRYAAPTEIPALMDFDVAGLYAISRLQQGGFESEWAVFGDTSIALVSTEGQKAIYLYIESGKVVQIEFSELSAYEELYDFRGEYVLPPM
jgi:hypothetical protein